MARGTDKPETGVGPFELEVFNANLSRSFVETVVNVYEGPQSFGHHNYRGTAIESENKQGQDVGVWYNGTQEAWQYDPSWQPSK